MLVLYKKSSIFYPHEQDYGGNFILPGGAEGIRTPAPVARSNGLANRPLEPLGYCSKHCDYSIVKNNFR